MMKMDHGAVSPGAQRRSRQPVSDSLDVYLTKWNLVADGDYILTTSSSLLPVRVAGMAAMLKVSTDPQGRVGIGAMEWWNGDGAARVLAREGDALLMERAAGSRSLAAMSRSGNDNEACRVLCATAQRLQTSRPNPPPELTPLEARFRDLAPAAAPSWRHHETKRHSRAVTAVGAARHRDPAWRPAP